MNTLLTQVNQGLAAFWRLKQAPNVFDIALAAQKYNIGPATLLAATANHLGRRVAIIDDEHSINWLQLEKKVAQVAAGLQQDYGLKPENKIAILCRNHIGAVISIFAASCTGAEIILLNSEFSAGQLENIIKDIDLIISDNEFFATLEQTGYRNQIIASEPNKKSKSIVEFNSRSGFSAASGHSKITMLTSGTTGTPKGAPRSPSPMGIIGPLTTLLGGLPIENSMAILLCPPLFHGFGLGFLSFALLTGMTIVLQRRFAANEALKKIDRYGIEMVAAVPVMYRRMLESLTSRIDTSSLKIMLTGGAALNANLASNLMKEFGPVLYNLYGSTETGFSTMASPNDLMAAPGTVGRPALGTAIRILDQQGKDVPQGQVGRIFIGNQMLFDGYSGGGNKQTIDGYMSIGDLGRFDQEGRLFVEGREDDMIISGGENVFPLEVEETLLTHEAVTEVAVIGVDDEEFGQRLIAFVVCEGETTSIEEQLKELIKNKLARFKMPKKFIFLAELPRNAGGKVLRRKLHQVKSTHSAVS